MAQVSLGFEVWSRTGAKHSGPYRLETTAQAVAAKVSAQRTLDYVVVERFKGVPRPCVCESQPCVCQGAST